MRYLLPLFLSVSWAWSISLQGPDVAKLDWNTHSLIAGDFNGDGKNDLACINNDRARIVLLFQKEVGEGTASVEEKSDYWEPVLDSDRFIKKSVVTAATMASLVSGDFNGDGNVDFGYISKNDPLVIHFGKGDGETWKDKKVFVDLKIPYRNTTTAAGNLNGDKLDDLAVLGENKLYILLQSKKEGLALAQEYPVHSDKVYNLEIVDVDKDGRADLRYISWDSEQLLQVRMQQEDGRFGPEISFPIKIKSEGIAPVASKQGAIQYAYVDGDSSLVTNVTLRKKIETGSDEKLLQVYRYPVGEKEEFFPLTSFDYNGDGLVDILAANGKVAFVTIFTQNEKGIFTATDRLDTFHDISKLQHAVSAEAGKEYLYMLTDKEGMLVVTERASGKAGVYGFPVPIKFEGEIKDFFMSPLFSSARAELILVAEVDKKHQLIYSDNGLSQAVTDWKTIDLGKIRKDIQGIRVLDINRDGLSDILIFIEDEPMRIFVQGEETKDGKFTEVAKDSILRDTLLSDVYPEQFGEFDLNNDGKEDIVFAGRGLLRSMIIDDKGALVITHQITVTEEQDALYMPMLFHFDKSKKEKDIIVYNENLGELFVMDHKNPARKSRYEIGEITVVDASLTNAGKNRSKNLLLLGQSQFWTLSLANERWVLDDLSVIDHPKDDRLYDRVFSGDLDGDGAGELLVVDDTNKEFTVYRQDNDDWKIDLGFTIFKQNAHFRGRKGQAQEPREVIVNDVTGDDKADIIFLIHDRLLVYFQ